MSMLVVWAVTPCGFDVDTTISEEHTDFISPEDGSGMLV
jgi:hypothetical protein